MKFDPPRRAVFIAGFAAFIDLYAPQSVLSSLSTEFQVTPADAGGIVGISTLAIAIAAPFAGLIADKFGQRRTMLTAIFLLVPVTALLAAVHGLNEMLALRFVQGLLLPAIFSSAVAFTAEYWSPAEAVDVTGLYVLGSILGGFSGRFLTAIAAEHFGWRGGFLALTAITALFAAGLWAWLPAHTRRGPSARPPGLGAFLDHLRNPPLLATCGVGAAVLFGNVATFTYIDFRLERPPFNLSPTALGMIFTVYLLGAVATPLSGAFIRRAGRRGALAIAASIGILGIAGTVFDWLPTVILGLALFVTSVFLAQTASLGFIGQVARHNKTSAVGLYVCSYYVGGSLGAVLPGSIWDSAGWPGCVALVVATTILATLLAMWAWRERKIVIAATE
ncbi:MAG TPA: MFS transporter [Magnetospirillaceae bacterium]|jgi:predicted MFS family arabinose efflux permease